MCLTLLLDCKLSEDQDWALFLFLTPLLGTLSGSSRVPDACHLNYSPAVMSLP